MEKISVRGTPIASPAMTFACVVPVVACVRTQLLHASLGDGGVHHDFVLLVSLRKLSRYQLGTLNSALNQSSRRS